MPWRWLLGAMVILAGCSTVPPPTTTRSLPVPSPTVRDATPSAGLLSIEASGMVGCDWMLGCGALLAIEPSDDPLATLPPAWRPSPWIDLPTEVVPEGGGRTMRVGRPVDAPVSLEPGRYRVVAGWAYADDQASFPPDPLAGPPITSFHSTCQTRVEVAEGAAVAISVTFALDGTCAVAAVAS